ncbi:MAG: NFYB/HAP3 family transcription factor subunit [Candidatus Aenigmarchaeota archaeon]|nr:NFYB/HAP3 family transcription factor subunit [Candidatus Aenigmarchaeota archaeon]
MLSILSFERIARKAGIKRISRKALQELQEMIDDEASEIAAMSVQISKHAERNTVMDRDVRLAAGLKDQ